MLHVGGLTHLHTRDLNKQITPTMSLSTFVATALKHLVLNDVKGRQIKERTWFRTIQKEDMRSAWGIGNIWDVWVTWYCHIQQIPMRFLQVVQWVRVYYSGVQAFVSQTLCILFWVLMHFWTFYFNSSRELLVQHRESPQTNYIFPQGALSMECSQAISYGSCHTIQSSCTQVGEKILSNLLV